MKQELQDEVIELLKALATALAQDDYATLGVGLIRHALGQGGNAEINAFAMKVATSMIRETEIAAPLIRQVGYREADDKMLRAELASLTDLQGAALVKLLPEFVKMWPPMLARGMKFYAPMLESPPGRMSALTNGQRSKICKRVLTLQAQGFSPGQAKKRAAAEFKVSISTLNRIWRDRAALLADAGDNPA